MNTLESIQRYSESVLRDYHLHPYIRKNLEILVDYPDDIHDVVRRLKTKADEFVRDSAKVYMALIDYSQDLKVEQYRKRAPIMNLHRMDGYKTDVRKMF